MMHGTACALIVLYTNILTNIATHIWFEYEEIKHILFVQLRRARGVHMWNFQSSVLPSGQKPLVYAVYYEISGA